MDLGVAESLWTEGWLSLYGPRGGCVFVDGRDPMDLGLAESLWT